MIYIFNSAKFLMTQFFILSLSAVLLYFLVPIGGYLDLTLIQPWLALDGQFYLKDTWSLSQLSHHYVKYVLELIYLLFGLLSLKFISNPWGKIQAWQYAYFFCMVCLATIFIAALKQLTNHACPWDLTEQTSAGYIWNLTQKLGHCFPGGHASCGFALMTGYFVFRKQYIGLARFFLYSGVILGFFMGWAQMMRGAHFLSHNLWSAWWVWMLNVVCYALIYLPIDERKTQTRLRFVDDQEA